MSAHDAWPGDEADMAARIERAMGSLERALSAMPEPAYARDVIASVRKDEPTLSEEAIRHAVWRLISEGKAQLTDQRKLSVHQPATT